MDSFAFEALNLERAIVPNPHIVDSEMPLGDVIMLMHGAKENIFFLNPETDEELIQLEEARASCVLVVQESELIGIFTIHDVVKVSGSGQPPSNLAIAQVVTHQPITLQRSQFHNPLTALKLLTQHQIHHLPIVDDRQQVVGLVTSSTLRRVLQPTDLLRLQQVADVMLTDVLQVDFRTPLMNLARSMAERRAECALITDNPSNATQLVDLSNKKVFPVGLVTSWDVVEAQKLGIDFAKVQVGAIMQTPVPCLSAEDLLWAAHQKIQRSKAKVLAVLGKQGELVGMITESTLLRTIDVIEMRYQLDWHQQQLIDLHSKQTEFSQQQVIHLNERVKLQQTQAQLQQSKAFYRQLVEEAAVGVWLLDSNHQTTFVNRFLLDLLGYAPQDMRYKQLADFWEGDTIELSPAEPALNQRSTYEGLLRSQDGSQHWVSLTLTLLFDQADRWVNTLATVTNMDAYRLNMNRLSQKNQLLEQVIEQAPMPIAIQDHTSRYLLANLAMAELHGLGTTSELINRLDCEINPTIDHSPQQQPQTQRVTDNGRRPTKQEGQEERFLLGHREVWIRWQRQLLPTLDSSLPQELVVGTYITAQKQVETDLKILLEGTAATIGEDFFSRLVQDLALTLKVEQVMVGQIIGDRLQTLAYWADNQLQAKRSDALVKTPHLALTEHSTYCCAHSLQQKFSDAENYLAQPAESYLGISLKSETGYQIMGILCILDSQPIDAPSRHLALLKAFAVRSARELDRLNTIEELQRATKELENHLEEHRAALKESDDRARMAANSLPIPVWMTAKDGQYIFFNQAWLAFTGLSVEDAEGYRWAEHIHPDDAKYWKETYHEALKMQSPFRVEYRLKPADGKYRWVLDTGKPRFQDGVYLGYTGSCIDITEHKQVDSQPHCTLPQAKQFADEKAEQIRKQLEQEHRQALEWARNLLGQEFGEMNQRLLKILRGLSDPIGAIANAANTLEEWGHCLKEETKQKHLQEIQAANQTMKDLLAEVTLDAIPGSGIQFRPTHFDMEALCKEVVNELKAQQFTHQILFTLELDKNFNQPSQILDAYADPELVRHILDQLLSNAIKYSPGGGVIYVRLMERNGMIALQVKDEGIGIPLDDQRRGLFQAFRRGQNVGNTSGNGLGLAIVKQLVDLHGGRVALTSQPGEGTSCTVFFPIQNSDGFAA